MLELAEREAVVHGVRETGRWPDGVEGLTAFDSWLDQFVVKEQAANLLPMAWGAQLLEFGRRESKATVVRSPGRGFAETIE